MIHSFISCLLFCLLYSSDVLATVGLGEVAVNLSEPLTLITQLIRAICMICGGALVLGAVLKFIEYRRNPIAVRLSTVFFMLLFGAALILLGLIPMHIYEEAKRPHYY